MNATYNIYEIADNEFVALPDDEYSPYDYPDGRVEMDVTGEWIPGSQQDLRAMLADKAIEKWCRQSD